MTQRLKKAFDEASKLPQGDQDTLASWLLEELKAEREWDRRFAESQGALAELANEAMREHRAGRTQDLDPL